MIVFLILFLTSCASVNKSPKTTMVLSYSDFGPQAMAYETIGYEWWQWLPSGNEQHQPHDIKVIVYKDTDLASVKSLYPVNPGKNKDYRYIDHQAAMLYLDKNIEENVLPQLTLKLVETRLMVREFLGRPSTENF